MSELQVLAEFKNGLISFFDELVDQFPYEGDLIMFRIFLKDQIPIEDVMIIFVNNIYKDDGKLKKMIKDRNELFFLKTMFLDLYLKIKLCIFKNYGDQEI